MSVSIAVPSAAPRDRSIEARRASRVEKFRRERRILDFLNRGVTIAEIAAREGVTAKHMRALVRELLADRMPEPPAEFLALQVSRLSEALIVAYSAMSGGNLRAVDRVVKILRELDRYHGFVAVERRSLDAPRLEAPPEGALALGAPLRDRLEMAPQEPEKIKSAPASGMVPDSSDEATRLSPPAQGPTDAPLTDRAEMAPQEPEKAQSAPANGMAPDSSAEATRLAQPAQGPTDAPPTDRLETAPQEPEKAQIPPGNGRAPDSPAEATRRAPPAQDPTDAPLAHRVEMAPQEPEKARSAPGNGWAPDPREAASLRGEAFASRCEAPAQDPLPFEAPLIRRIEKTPQAPERAQSALQNGMDVESARALGGASFVNPTIVHPSGVKRLRATPNGVAAF